MLDHLSGGRVSYTLGLGYRREEYDLFGVAWETRGRDIEDRITPDARRLGERRGDARAVLAAAPDAVLRRRLGRGREAGRPARPALPAAGRRPGAEGGLRGGVPGAGPRARLHPARAGRPGQRVLRRRPGRASGSGTATTCSPTPRGTPRGGRADTSSYVRDDSSTVEEMRAAGVYVVLTADELVERVPGRRDPAGHQPPGLRRAARRAVVGVAAADQRDGAAGRPDVSFLRTRRAVLLRTDGAGC